MPEIYASTQQAGIGKYVTTAGYRIMGAVDLTGRTVLEIGPGQISHDAFWRGRPALYVLVDRRAEFLEQGVAKLQATAIAVETHLVEGAGSSRLPLPDASVDVIVSFYSLEHLSPLEEHLAEMLRVLRPGGLLVGSIPAEGGLAWGLGRLLTTTRWVRRNTSIDYTKIICWEHPNFADRLLRALDACMIRKRIRFWPLRLPLIDLNLVISFVYEAKGNPPRKGSGKA